MIIILLFGDKFKLTITYSTISFFCFFCHAFSLSNCYLSLTFIVICIYDKDIPYGTNTIEFERKYIMRDGKSIENAILIETQDYISGVLEEHNYIDGLCKNLNIEIISIEQNLILKDDKKYDMFIIEMDDGRKRKVYFDITLFFIS